MPEVVVLSKEETEKNTRSDSKKRRDRARADAATAWEGRAQRGYAVFSLELLAGTQRDVENAINLLLMKQIVFTPMSPNMLASLQLPADVRSFVQAAITAHEVESETNVHKLSAENQKGFSVLRKSLAIRAQNLAVIETDSIKPAGKQKKDAHPSVKSQKSPSLVERLMDNLNPKDQKKVSAVIATELASQAVEQTNTLQLHQGAEVDNFMRTDPRALAAVYSMAGGEVAFNAMDPVMQEKVRRRAKVALVTDSKVTSVEEKAAEDLAIAQSRELVALQIAEMQGSLALRMADSNVSRALYLEAKRDKVRLDAIEAFINTAAPSEYWAAFISGGLAGIIAGILAALLRTGVVLGKTVRNVIEQDAIPATGAMIGGVAQIIVREIAQSPELFSLEEASHLLAWVAIGGVVGGMTEGYLLYSGKITRRGTGGAHTSDHAPAHGDAHAAPAHGDAHGDAHAAPAHGDAHAASSHGDGHAPESYGDAQAKPKEPPFWDWRNIGRQGPRDH